MTDKLNYEAPELELVGSFEEVTLGNSTGDDLDKDFVAGTSFNDLTFS
ncbi:lasso RiPP family leader peptide-containing protein [Marinicaulis aureus]|uniref:Lasso RiPP family leader peptide-containing protein n=1 Tax=Hyphococcus aureus TaxID=2666033 RepID=A0ABW1KV84_9PROT